MASFSFQDNIFKKDKAMKSLIISAMLVVGASSAMVVAAEDAGSYVKDSVITTKVKTKLAAKHMSTLAHIKVDTDANGAVWLSGKAPTKDAADLAEQITKDTDGVTSVHNKIVVAP
jgi:hyperosmotically inducible protein